MYNASHGYVKISVFTEMMIWMRERDAECVQSNSIKNRCIRILILKLVNPLESFQDRFAIHIWIYFYVHP